MIFEGPYWILDFVRSISAASQSVIVAILLTMVTYKLYRLRGKREPNSRDCIVLAATIALILDLLSYQIIGKFYPDGVLHALFSIPTFGLPALGVYILVIRLSERSRKFVSRALFLLLLTMFVISHRLPYEAPKSFLLCGWYACKIVAPK
ncbi:MAG: hypothetical protein ACAH83_15365 [Alphaproteobacteria bacterium]